MRRSDKEITRREDIDAVIARCEVCRLALAKDNVPYIVPVSFGYDGESLFFHTAKTGRKIDYIEANNLVCFEFDCDVVLHRDDNDACSWTFSFQSIVGSGPVAELIDPDEKQDGLNRIMQQYSGRSTWDFDAVSTAATRVWRLDIESISGKRSENKSPAD